MSRETGQRRVREAAGAPVAEAAASDSPSILLSEERRRWVRGCLRKAEIVLDARSFGSFMVDIEATMSWYEASVSELKVTFRKQHDARRSLWHLADRHDPPIGMIRRSIAQLPAEVMTPIDERACRIVPRLEGRDLHLLRNEDQAVDLQIWLGMGGFRKWAANADVELLLEAVKLCVATGSAAAKGYRLALEPRILGVVRRGPGQKSVGGRPRAMLDRSLVRRLSSHWYSRTGEMPEQGRSDETGFGDFVHRVFQWLGLGHGKAAYALRTHWSEICRRERERKVAILETD
jgi:hypothetical protein